MYSYKTGLGQVWVGSKLPPNSGSNIIWLRPSDDHKVLWEIRTYNIYKERWEVLTSAALTAEGLLILIRDLEKRCKSLEELKVVLYDTIQNLTPEEQKIARQNIGAISLEDLPPQVEVVQEVGSSTTAVMSQNAVTEELSKKASPESVTESISAHNTSTIAHTDIRELLNTCVGLPAYDSSSYKITFTTLAGATVEIDLPIEQLALRYNAETDSIEFDNADGTTTSIPVSAFVKEYVGSIGDRIQVSIDENNIIHATILKNSIDWDCLSFELQERINDHVTSADFATKAVRTDIAQTLTTAQQVQAFANLGMKVYVTDSSFIESTLTAEVIEQVDTSKVILFTDTGELFLFGLRDSGRISFYRFNSPSSIIELRVSIASNRVERYPTSYNDSKALHFTVQTLTGAQQSQVFKNLGWKVHVISESAIGSSDAVSDDEKAARLSATALLVKETGEMYIYGHNSSSTPSDRRFYRFRDTKTLALLNVVTTTGLITQPLFVNIYDDNAVSFSIDQSRGPNDRKDTALSNIGLNWIHVPYSLLNTTLDDETYTKLTNAYGIILTDVPSDYTGPIEFIRGALNTKLCVFAGLYTQTSIARITIYPDNKLITRVYITRTYEGAVPYDASVTLTSKQQEIARTNIKAVGSSMIKGVEIVYGAAPMQEDNILYIELEETT